MADQKASLGRRGVLALPLLGFGAAGALAQGTAQAPGNATPQRGGILPFAVAAEPPTYDLHATGTFAVMHRLAPHYSTLLRFEPHNYPNIIGDLAQSWEVAPDFLTFTFKLHPNVRFHDGSILTSEDVKASWDRLRAPPAGVVSNKLASFSKIASIETPDPLTVVFRMSGVDASMMDVFASPWNAIYSAAKLRADPNFPARNVMGTGPFRFVEHVAGSHWVGERFDGYFRQGLPYLDGFRAITMSASAMVNALAGRQVLAEFRGFSPAERDRIVRGLGAEANVRENSFMLHMICTFNNQRKPFDDPRVRRALSLAIDRWGGSAALSRISSLGPVGGLVRPGSEFAATTQEMEQWPGYGRDMAANRAEARQLLKEAGAENLQLTLVDRAIAPYVTSGIFLIDQWRQIGVRATHQQLELAAWYQAQASGAFDAFVDSFAQYSDDPTTVLSKYISMDRSPSAAARVTDRELDRLFDEQARTVDKAARRALVRQFEARLFSQNYAVPILWWQRILVMHRRVQNYPNSPSHMVHQSLAEVWLTPS
jgi:peptide/nickel transport system substrate-binding protein